jgi:hypothetical protein
MNIEVDKRRRILVSRPLHQFGYEEFKFKKGRFVKIKSVSNKEALKHVEIH